MDEPKPRRPRWKRTCWKRTWWWAAALSVAFVVLGYRSNAVTAPTCERATSQWINAKLATNPTNWPGRNASSKSAKYQLPWLASVEYNLALGNLGGEHGRRYYLCLFGYAMPLWNEVEIQA